MCCWDCSGIVVSSVYILMDYILRLNLDLTASKTLLGTIKVLFGDNKHRSVGWGLLILCWCTIGSIHYIQSESKTT